ncbi:hypothetical protein [Pedobacter sp. UBA4863]|uniref:hypothetical protein n=1 Tax=Pedobacter sp. UBA4863 TaxID=1947060 RepID=UPI0025F98BD6|nr:hypothetical protein [Pedobacter sp. UBA4863]
MKTKLFALLIIGSAVVASSCNKIKEATNKDITFTSADVTLTVNAPLAESTIASDIAVNNVEGNLDALIKSNTKGAFGIKNVKSLKVKTLTAEIIQGQNASNSFDNLESLSVVISAAGKADFKVAKSSATSNTATKISFDVSSSTDLRDLISASTITYKLNSKVKPALSQTLKIKLVTTYDAVVGL